MKVKGKKTEVSTVEIEITPTDIVKTLKEHCYKILDLPETCYIEDGEIVKYVEEYGGGHSWTIRTVVEATPSELQIEAITLFSQLSTFTGQVYTLGLKTSNQQ